MQKTFNVAIIGAGSIGGLIDTPKSVNIASHAHAYAKENTCSLKAICEVDKNNRDEFIKRWGKVNTYATTQELVNSESIDILSIASPTKYHLQNLQEALQMSGISHILCEKPLVLTQKELTQIKEELLKSDKKILINIIRRYNPIFIDLAKQIKKNGFGKVLSFHGNFTKGLLHNGIHMLELLNHLFGKICKLKSLNVKQLEDDLSGEFYIECENAKGSLVCIESIDYSLFELDIVFENGKIQISDGGDTISIYKKVPSVVYEGYFTLKHSRTLKDVMQKYASDSLNFLLNENHLKCKEILKEHIKIHEIIFETIKKERQL